MTVNKLCKCGNKIKRYDAKQCSVCYQSRTRKTSFCLDCGKKLANHRSKRCQTCWGKTETKEKNPNWKGGKKLLPLCIDCGKQLSVDYVTRCFSCSKIGSKNPAWLGGRGSLSGSIRGLEESVSWRTKVFERDKYTCRICGENGSIEAHHIKPFRTIFSEFLTFYKQFSPIEDKEILVRLSLSYSPFWDINNGITLCKDCHSYIPKRDKVCIL